MISQLLATIMMALGVASGTKATSNTFYDAEKPTPKRAASLTTLIDLNSCYNQIQYISQNGDPYTFSRKYYLSDGINNGNAPTFYNQYLNIYNSTYTYQTGYKTNANLSRANLVSVMQIDNYTATSLVNITLQFDIEIDTESNQQLVNSYGRQIIYTSSTQEFSNYIDRTLTTANAVDDMYTELYNTSLGNQVVNTEITYPTWTYQTATHYKYIFTNTITIPYIEAHSNIQVVIMNHMIAPIANNDAFIMFNLTDTDTTISIQGYQNETNINYEVVDIPGMMYTILTMPFSFISTAFNLTVFPGTPYALNFGNLFLTLIAIFILLWLIKKVFH